MKSAEWESGYQDGKNGIWPTYEKLQYSDYEDGFITGRVHDGDNEETAKEEARLIRAYKDAWTYCINCNVRIFMNGKEEVSRRKPICCGCKEIRNL